MKFTIGSVVTPVTAAGLWLADTPVNGERKQCRKNVCVFGGTGTVLAVSTCVVDYDEWDLQEYGIAYNLGRAEYTSYLIQCEAGVGWAGEGAIVLVNLG